MRRLMVACVLYLAISLIALPLMTDFPSAGAQSEQKAITGSVLKAANLRAGPGTNYAVVGSAKAGQVVTVVGKNAKGDWLKLADGSWIATFLVGKLSGAVSVVGVGTPVATPMVKVTATPKVVTGKPTATATVVPLSAKDQVYASAIINTLSAYGESMGTVGVQFTAAGERIGLILTDEWKITVAVAFAKMQNAGKDLRALTPPPKFAEVHGVLLEMADHYDLAVVYASEGIDEVDVDKLTLAVAEMEEGNRLMREAQSMVEEIAKELGL